ncbi:MAG: hypothetical protein JWN36_3085, partial [Microbacteriaceae bacterium]|nr:hypothetical protein [Microbacteriaceae bacterium]
AGRVGAAGAAVVAVALFAAPAPARAAGDILVSSDGVTFAPALPAALFDGVGALVPGDSVTRTLWVDNATGSEARMQLATLARSATPSIGRALQISVAASGAMSAHTLDTGCALLLSMPRVAPAARMPLTVTISMANVPGRVAQNESLDMSLLVSMSDPGGAAPAACPADATAVPLGTGRASAPSLAFTGAGLPLLALAAAAFAVALGLGLRSGRAGGER